MKIYQLHMYSGEYEDSYDHIVGSYLKRERAEEEKKRREATENKLFKIWQRCERCPFIGEDFIKPLLAKYPDYCANHKLYEDEYGIDCDNRCYYHAREYFEIKEVEVEE